MTARHHLPGTPFSLENGGEYCTAWVQRHAPTLVAFTNRKGSRTALRPQARAARQRTARAPCASGFRRDESPGSASCARSVRPGCCERPRPLPSVVVGHRRRRQIPCVDQSATTLETSPINLREWINRLWVFYGKPIRPRLRCQPTVRMNRLCHKKTAHAASAGACSGCCW